MCLQCLVSVAHLCTYLYTHESLIYKKKKTREREGEEGGGSESLFVNCFMMKLEGGGSPPTQYPQSYPREPIFSKKITVIRVIISHDLHVEGGVTGLLAVRM